MQRLTTVRRKNGQGITLTEILVALGIVALIAVFTIPKVLESSHSSDEENWRRVVKQDVGIVEGAYAKYKLDHNSVPTSFQLQDATPYFNYVRQETVAQVDGSICFGAPIDCSSPASRCYVLQNGSVLHWYPAEDFGNTSATNAVKFRVDPDGKVTGAAGQHPGKAVALYLYYKSGKIRSRQGIEAATYGGTWGPENPGAICDPSWWNWN